MASRDPASPPAGLHAPGQGAVLLRPLLRPRAVLVPQPVRRCASRASSCSARSVRTTCSIPRRRIGWWNLWAQLRMMVTLRDPADRAFSSYLHMLRSGWEPVTFDSALDRYPELIDHGRYATHLERFVRAVRPGQHLHRRVRRPTGGSADLRRWPDVVARHRLHDARRRACSRLGCQPGGPGRPSCPASSAAEPRSPASATTATWSDESSGHAPYSAPSIER